ncbi:MAG: glycosyltransferase, partial [Phormidesmis sp.]
MKPLKILQIVPSISLVYGGPSQMVRGLSAALAEQPTDRVSQVTVITTDSNGDVDEAPLAVPLNQPVVEDGYEVIYFRCSPFRRYKFSPSLLTWLWQNAHRYDIAHIHALFSPASTSAATVCRWQKLPYIMRPLG